MITKRQAMVFRRAVPGTLMIRAKGIGIVSKDGNYHEIISEEELKAIKDLGPIIEGLMEGRIKNEKAST